MPKKRVPIDEKTSSRLVFQSDFTCCVCRDRSLPAQIHHIDDNPSNNAPSNLALLCLICHEKTQIRGGFGRKLNANIVKEYQVDWLERVSRRREDSDAQAVAKMSGISRYSEERSTQDAVRADQALWRSIPADAALVGYVESLPNIVAGTYEAMQSKLAGSTYEIVEGCYSIVDVVVQILVHLAEWFPENHFGNVSSQEYFSVFVSNKAIWRRALETPGGEEDAGTMARIGTAFGVLKDVMQAVDEMVSALLFGREGFYILAWRKAWGSTILSGIEDSR